MNDFDDDPLMDEVLPDYQEVEDIDSSSNEEEVINTPIDFIDSLLQSRGIKDRDKINLINDETGEVEETRWDDIPDDVKLNIINSTTEEDDNDLDNDEIELINMIRESKLSPKEYLKYIQDSSINEYMTQQSQPNYQVDDINDDELFVLDLVGRTGVSEEEANRVLDKLKNEDEAILKKQIDAIRNEYKKAEDENIRYYQHQQQQQQQEAYNKFAEGIENQIVNFNEFAGYDVDMDNAEMQQLYEFITGFDKAGNSYFGKALSDPSTVVKMAWFALNGENMVNSITEYYKKEIANVRKESYNKGLQARDNSKTVFKPINKKQDRYDDSDDI